MNDKWTKVEYKLETGCVRRGRDVYLFSTNDFQGASNKQWIGLLGNKIRRKTITGNRGLMVESYLIRDYDDTLCYNHEWKKICVGSVGQLSKDTCRIEKGEKWGKRARKSRVLGKKRIGRLDGRESTDLSCPFGGMFGGRVRERNAYCRSAKPNRAPTVCACVGFV